MPSRAEYERELETVKERIKDISHKIALNDMRMERAKNSGGIYIDQGFFWKRELARQRERRLDLLYILRNKK